MKNFFKMLFTVCIFSLLSPVLADDVDSGSFTILDFSFNSNDSTPVDSANFKSIITSDEYISDVRFSSGTYRIGAGILNTWKASVPQIQCFETTTSGSTSCNDADVAGGMVQVCGTGGCYNKARFEINPSGNPTDTLYSARISTDPTFATWDYIDGATFLTESAGNHDINDYLTESAWEGTVSNFNVIGLTVNTAYYIKITALHGDFTETESSPSATATTSTPSLSFDIDIATTAGSGAETSAPYAISLGSLITGQVTTATNVVWMDIGTNANAGAKVYGRSLNGGLYSSSRSYTITMGDYDLDSVTGYGVRRHNALQTYLGPLSPQGAFAGGGNSVGGLTTQLYSTLIFSTSSQPIFGGRGSLYVKAKPPIDAPTATDYTDTLTFTIAGNI